MILLTAQSRVAIMLRLCLNFGDFYPRYAYRRYAYKTKHVFINTPLSSWANVINTVNSYIKVLFRWSFPNEYDYSNRILSYTCFLVLLIVQNVSYFLLCYEIINKFQEFSS